MVASQHEADVFRGRPEVQAVTHCHIRSYVSSVGSFCFSKRLARKNVGAARASLFAEVRLSVVRCPMSSSVRVRQCIGRPRSNTSEEDQPAAVTDAARPFATHWWRHNDSSETAEVVDVLRLL